ncbi:MAG: transketolase family protein [Candidatus Omnitrophota bacterium]|nr:transketolase family protein [Candidatus Omnitrophota bacterium]
MSEKMMARDVYGETLVELGRKNKDIVVLDADLSGSTRTVKFGKAFPERFFNIGVAEQNLIGVAGGLASCNKTVFASTFAIFASGRAWDQVRNTIVYNKLNVKIVASHAGITVGPDGASHQAVEDIALFRVLPEMVIMVPCDGPQTRDIIRLAAGYKGPVYVRMGRAKIPTIENKPKFEMGKAQILRQGRDVSIIACGIMVKNALDAAGILAQENKQARVVNMHTIKPIDRQAIIDCAKQTKGIVVCEEHMINGGLAGAVSEVSSESAPVPIQRIGIKNRFGQSGSPDELLKKYNLTAGDIVEACRKLMQ